MRGMYMNSNITIYDKLIIYFYAARKLVRGFLTKPFLKRSKGFLFIGKRVSITHSKHIVCGKNVKFEAYCEIHGLSSEGLLFGDNVTIGRYSEIRPSSYYGVGEIGKGLVIGYNSSIGPNAYIGCSGKIQIGNNVMIGPKCSMFAENHNFLEKNKDIKYQGVNQRGIIIEDNCWIGSNVIILDGVKIGTGSVIGAGAIVTKSIPKNTIFIDKQNAFLRER
jgi:acetyltransferase-like isoleucine patch superfamily enzyme